MAYVFRRPWRRVRQPRTNRLVKTNSAVNTITPFTSVASGAVVESGVAANTIGAFTSSADGDLGLVGTGANTLAPFTSHASGVSYQPNFIPGTVVGATNPCLQDVIPSYLYQQYSNDDDLQAFVAAYNTLTQQYVDWLNTVNLPVYTGPLIVGTLLDWVALGLYGVQRPALSADTIQTLGPFDTYHMDEMPFAGRRTVGPAVYTPVTDDVFKRVLTWKLYKGDGKVIDLRWLKQRIMRFLLGGDGTDVNVANTQQVSITFGGNTITITNVVDSGTNLARGPLYNAVDFNAAGFNLQTPRIRITQQVQTYQHDNQVNINFISHKVTALSGAYFNKFAGNAMAFNSFRPAATQNFSPLPNTAIFKQAVDQGVLDMPFQMKVVVNIK